MATSANGTVLADYTTAPRTIAIHAKLNIRDGASRTARLVRRAEPAERLLADQLLDAEPFLGNSHWYREASTGNFFWAGAGEPIAIDEPPVGGIQVDTRADGTIRPLSNNDIMKRFGSFDYSSNGNGSITITTPNWERDNLVPLTHPLLAGIGHSRLRVHVKAESGFRAALDDIAAAGAGSRILTCAGTFVARHKAWNPLRGLSSHSWGIAIDFNAEWNAYGNRPTLPGLAGSVQELVPFFARHGFAWGGHFSGRDCDGMHFEFSRLDV